MRRAWRACPEILGRHLEPIGHLGDQKTFGIVSRDPRRKNSKDLAQHLPSILPSEARFPLVFHFGKRLLANRNAVVTI